MSQVSLEAARRAKTAARDLVSRSASVTGVGLMRLAGDYAVKVNLRDQPPAGLPQEIDGVPLVYERTGGVTPR